MPLYIGSIMANIPFSTRLRLARKAVLGLFSDSAAEEASGMLATFLPAGVSTMPKRSTGELLRYYSVSPLLQMVVRRIATSIARTPWSITRTDDPNAEPILDHGLLRILNRGNQMFLGKDIRQLTQIWRELVGEAFWILEQNRGGQPAEIIPVPPHWVKETPTAGKPYFEVRSRFSTLQIPSEHMLWIKDPDPYDPYGRGTGIAASLADELETDEYAAKHVKSFFRNRARPEILVTGPGLNREAAKRLERQWLDKLQGRAHLPHFMDAPVGVSIKELSQSFTDLELVELRKHEREIVMNVFGVPPEIFGVVENSNRATIDAADYLFAKLVLVPRLDDLRDVYQERLLPLFGSEDLEIRYESPVQEDREHELEAAKAAPWALTVNEWREIAGRDAKDDGDVHMLPLKLTPQANLAEDVIPEVQEDELKSYVAAQGDRFSSAVDVAIGALKDEKDASEALWNLQLDPPLSGDEVLQIEQIARQMSKKNGTPHGGLSLH